MSRTVPVGSASSFAPRFYGSRNARCNRMSSVCFVYSLGVQRGRTNETHCVRRRSPACFGAELPRDCAETRSAGESRLVLPEKRLCVCRAGAAAGLAFWRNYFGVLGQATAHAHVHAAAMSLWIILLVAQAFLIRSDARAAHRTLGTLSYLLVPIIVLSTLAFSHARLGERGVERGLALLYIQLSGLFLFAVSWSLAIWRRKSPVLHAGYIVCSAIALIDPIFFRIFNRYVMPTSIRAWLSPSVLTYSMTTVAFLWLIARNPTVERKIGVYPVMLALFLVVQIPTFFAADMHLWRAFAVHFLAVPLP